MAGDKSIGEVKISNDGRELSIEVGNKIEISGKLDNQDLTNELAQKVKGKLVVVKERHFQITNGEGTVIPNHVYSDPLEAADLDLTSLVNASDYMITKDLLRSQFGEANDFTLITE